jgi:hypothetical protein
MGTLGEKGEVYPVVLLFEAISRNKEESDEENRDVSESLDDRYVSFAVEAHSGRPYLEVVDRKRGKVFDSR